MLRRFPPTAAAVDIYTPGKSFPPYISQQKQLPSLSLFFQFPSLRRYYISRRLFSLAFAELSSSPKFSIMRYDMISSTGINIYRNAILISLPATPRHKISQIEFIFTMWLPLCLILSISLLIPASGIFHLLTTISHIDRLGYKDNLIAGAYSSRWPFPWALSASAKVVIVEAVAIFSETCHSHVFMSGQHTK